MHELSIAIGILDAVEEEVATKGYGAVEAVHVRVGELSGVVTEALRSAMSLAQEHTAFDHVRFVIESVPIVIHCTQCQADRTLPSAQELACPACGRPATDVISGRELEIFALELAA